MLLMFFIMWIVFNGRVTAEVCLIGLPVAAVLYIFMCKFMGYSLRKELRFLRLSGYLAVYLLVLLSEIIKASIKVFAIIVNKNIPLRQSVVSFDIDLKSRFTRVILANSITLTPGTITVSVDGQRYTVHCLSPDMIEGIQDSTFMRLLRKMEA